jgi:hypothetical protein
MFKKLLLLGVATAGCLFVFDTNTADARGPYARWGRRTARQYNRGFRRAVRPYTRSYYRSPYYGGYYGARYNRQPYYGGYYQPSGVYVGGRGVYVGSPYSGFSIRY